MKFLLIVVLCNLVCCYVYAGETYNLNIYETSSAPCANLFEGHIEKKETRHLSICFLYKKDQREITLSSLHMQALYEMWQLPQDHKKKVLEFINAADTKKNYRCVLPFRSEIQTLINEYW